MKPVRQFIWLILICLGVSAAPAAFPVFQSPASAQEQQESVLVGRISEVSGELLRYIPDDQDWVATVKDSPFGMTDALYSGQSSRAEIIMPNNTWLRIGGTTQVQLIALQSDVSEIDVASGMARFYNKGPATMIKATTPFGYVAAPAGSTFDLYVGDNSLEVIALQGKVDFVHARAGEKYQVMAGSASLLADHEQVTSGNGSVVSDWDAWNGERDQVWAQRVQVRGESTRYLPRELHEESYVLEENGRWERVYYDGAYRNFWRPATVAPGWAPFTTGRWTVWSGEQTWIPYEPFGYVTHHYGNWVFVNDYWYWGPPAVWVGVGARPAPLGIGFGWYPGRVSWIHSGAYIGWIPLAPFEPYYCHRPWGRRAVVVNNINVTNININNYRYVNKAVVVNRNNFYNVNNYNDVRIRNVDKSTIVKNYRAAPVINNTVINDYSTLKQKYNYTNVNVTEKPQRSVVNRIEQNDRVARQGGGIKASGIERDLGTLREGRPAQGAKIDAPTVPNRLVPGNEVPKTGSELKARERDIQEKGVSKSEVPAQPPGGGDKPSAFEKPGREKVQPPLKGPRQIGAPGQVGEPGKVREPGQVGAPGPVGEPGKTKAPGQMGAPGQEAPPRERVPSPLPQVPRQAPSGQSGQPAVGGEQKMPRPPAPTSPQQVPSGQTGQPALGGDQKRPRPPAPTSPQQSPAGQGGQLGGGEDRSRDKIRTPSEPAQRGSAGQVGKPASEVTPGQVVPRRERVRPTPPQPPQQVSPGQGGQSAPAGREYKRVPPPAPESPDQSPSGLPGQPGSQGQGKGRNRQTPQYVPGGAAGQSGQPAPSREYQRVQPSGPESRQRSTPSGPFGQPREPGVRQERIRPAPTFL